MRNWLFGENINTDLITPGRYNITTDPKELAKIVFIEYLPKFAKKVKRGDFIIAGKNFGSGSSRETAVTALKASGIKAIIAPSFARIFYRNSLNNGLLLVTADTIRIKEKDVLKLDLKNNYLINKTQKYSQKIKIPEMMIKLHQENGVINFLKKQGLNALSKIIQHEEKDEK